MDIAAWLRGLGLERYEQAFRDNDITADLLPTLTEADLREIGVASLGHRRKLLTAMAEADSVRLWQAHTSASWPPHVAVCRARTASRAAAADGAVLRPGRTRPPSPPRLDPEDLQRDRRRVPRRAAEVIERWAGHIADYHGRRRAGLLRPPAGARGRRRTRDPRRARAGRGGRRARDAGRPPAPGPGRRRHRPGGGRRHHRRTVARGSAARSARHRTWRPGCRRSPRRARWWSAPARGGWSPACSSLPSSARTTSRASPRRCRLGACCGRAGPRAASRRARRRPRA